MHKPYAEKDHIEMDQLSNNVSEYKFVRCKGRVPDWDDGDNSIILQQRLLRSRVSSRIYGI